MLFNSLEFAIFLPIVFALHWFAFRDNRRGQNFLLVIASYIFYGWWDWRFLGLVLFNTVFDYYAGLLLGWEQRKTRKKFFMLASILVNLGLLGYFKYANFFLDSFVEAFSFFGQEISIRSLNVILPVGISFYTFQSLSYTIDIYRGKLKPTREPLAYAAFVSFFPQLVAGPIERAARLLPQFSSDRHFDADKAVDGLRQILWGLFKKVVVADRCAVFADLIFNGAGEYSGSTLALGAVFFAFQIYGDFSGYSDIAIGVARLFGFNLMKNFAFPYFSRDIGEFWRRWHISMTSWFRDYVYIPLGGSRKGTWITIRNTFIIFLVSGLWHGANWTFLAWGMLNAIYFLPLMISGRNRENLGDIAPGRILPSVKDIFSIGFTFALITFAWIFFRAEDINHLSLILSRIFSASLWSIPMFFGRQKAAINLLLAGFLILVEWLGRDGEHGLQNLGLTWKPVFRWLGYYGIIYIILLFSESGQQFIYFQF